MTIFKNTLPVPGIVKDWNVGCSGVVLYVTGSAAIGPCEKNKKYKTKSSSLNSSSSMDYERCVYTSIN